MAEYIDREAAVKVLAERIGQYNEFVNGGSLDASGFCDQHNGLFVRIHFCSYGERKDGDPDGR